MKETGSIIVIKCRFLTSVLRTDTFYSSLHGSEVSVIQLPNKRDKEVYYTPMELYYVGTESDLRVLVSQC